MDTANATFFVTGVQLEVGEQATPFEHRSFGDELARCMRYFIQSSDDGDTSQFDGANVIFGWGSSTHNATTSAASGFQFKNKMRAVPTVTLYHQDGTSGAIYKVHDGSKITGVSAANISNQGVLQLSKATGFNQGIGYYCSYQADAEL
jgi:basic membrane lipoprotein Med (substrate-binding protein (PBP1-ABC) superfamily)